jgi:hypothetical protein
LFKEVAKILNNNKIKIKCFNFAIKFFNGQAPEDVTGFDTLD